MIYSRFLYTEYEGPLTSHRGDYLYVVMSTPQSHTPALGVRKSVGLQRFAVIWSGEPDLRVINLIEEAIVARVISPVKILHPTNGRLDIIVDQNLSAEKLKAFVYVWGSLVRKISKNEWNLVVTIEGQLTSTSSEASTLTTHYQEVLNTFELGVQDYSPKLSLLHIAATSNS